MTINTRAAETPGRSIGLVAQANASMWNDRWTWPSHVTPPSSLTTMAPAVNDEVQFGVHKRKSRSSMPSVACKAIVTVPPRAAQLYRILVPRAAEKGSAGICQPRPVSKQTPYGEWPVREESTLQQPGLWARSGQAVAPFSERRVTAPVTFRHRHLNSRGFSARLPRTFPGLNCTCRSHRECEELGITRGKR